MDHTTAALELDPQGKITQVEPGICILLGRTAEYLVGQPFSEFVEPDDQTGLRHLLTSSEQTQPNNHLRIRRSHRTSTISYEATFIRESGGYRIILSDVLSWRMVERGAATPPTLSSVTNSADHSCAFVLRLDQQWQLDDANASWEQLIQADSELGTLEWMYSFDTNMIESMRAALPAICTGTSFSTSGYVRTSSGRVTRVGIATCPLLTPDRRFAGFLVLGFEQAPMSDTERVLVQNTILFPEPIAPMNAEASQRPESLATHPDPMMRMAIASVLSAARAEFTAFDDDEPGLFDVPTHATDLAALLTPPKLAASERAELIDHLDTFHEDGLDAVVTVGLLLIDVEIHGTSQNQDDNKDDSDQDDNDEDGLYEFRVLEKRLRSAVRDHEYCAPLGSGGFVVAGRGTFDRAALEAFALRLTNRLQGPLRGYETSESPTISVVAITSQIGESDYTLLDRIEAARRAAATTGSSLYFG
jgi:hypothetical protein